MKNTLAMSALMVAITSSAAIAADANLTFNGELTAGTCVMDSSSLVQTVNMPDYSGPSLLAAGATAWQTFKTPAKVDFTNCPASIKNVNLTRISTTGTPWRGNTYRLIPASGTAKGIGTGIQLNNTPLPVNTDLKDNVAVVNSNATFPLAFSVTALKGWDSTTAPPSAGNYGISYTLSFQWS